jgi:hypothetical protein
MARPADGSGDAVPLELYPPGTDTNSLIISQASEQEQAGGSSASRTRFFGAMSGGNDSLEPGYTGSANQAAPAAPDRPPTAPEAGYNGTYGYAYQSYLANGTNGFVAPSPLANNGGIRTFVQMAGQHGSTPPTFLPLRFALDEAVGFTYVQGGAWQSGFTRGDDELTIGDLRGTNTPLNGVDVAFLLTHGTYGESQDFTAGGCKQMYFPIASGNGAQFLRMSEMKFGGDGTNGLKWLAFPACFSLYHVNWTSMQNQHIYPYNPGLHLLLGSDTVNYTGGKIGENWAKFMVGDAKATPPRSPVSIKTAWYLGSTFAYTNARARFDQVPIIFAATGDSACQGDMLQTKTNTVLSGSRFYETRQVYPAP